MFVLLLKINVRLTGMSCRKVYNFITEAHLSYSSTEVCLRTIFHPPWFAFNFNKNFSRKPSKPIQLWKCQEGNKTRTWNGGKWECVSHCWINGKLKFHHDQRHMPNEWHFCHFIVLSSHTFQKLDFLWCSASCEKGKKIDSKSLNWVGNN